MGSFPVPFPFSLLAKEFNTLAFLRKYQVQLRRRNEGVERGALSRSGVDNVPKLPVELVCGNGANRHIKRRKLTVKRHRPSYHC